MQNKEHSQNELISLLNEILIPASCDYIEERFSNKKSTAEAGCTGRCDSGGGCKGFV